MDFMNKPRGKYVYLVGNDSRGVVAHSYIKEDAKKFVKQRPDDNYNIVKAKRTEKIEQRLDQYMEITNTVLGEDRKYYLTESEELYILESIDTFMDDGMRYIESFIEHVKLLEFSDNESKEIKDFVKYLKKIYKVMKKADNGKYEEDEDEEPKSRIDLLDMNKVIEFAIKHLLSLLVLLNVFP